MIIDATDLVLGRFCAVAAKKAILGEKVDIVNCEKAIITGTRGEIIARYIHEHNRGTPGGGPFISRMPDRLVRRTIRGMVPRRGMRGRDAFERVMCYIGVPTQLEGKSFETLPKSNITMRRATRYIKLAELCKQLGAKI